MKYMSEAPRYWRLREQLLRFSSKVLYEDENCAVVSGFGETLYKFSYNNEPFQHITRLDLLKLQKTETIILTDNLPQTVVVYQAPFSG